MSPQQLLNQSLRFVNPEVRKWVEKGDRHSWLGIAHTFLHSEHPTKRLVTFMVKTYHIKVTGVVR